ncbi:MAG: Endoglucanase [Labilithrix sp.]|nr:Endoglucanase [Labilithrix sp.]
MTLALSSRATKTAVVLASLLLGACTADAVGAPATSESTLTGATVSESGEGPATGTKTGETSGALGNGVAGGESGNAKASPPLTVMPYRGVNLNSADFGSALPGVFGRDYTFPTNAEVDYYVGKGMNTFRIGFAWERLQPAAYGTFDATYANRLYSLVSYAESKGAHVVLNPQNFARYYGQVIGSAAVPNAVFANFWNKLSARWANHANVMFNLVNEPHDMPTEQWVSAANAAILAIRSTGATNTIIVPGNAWTGGWTWTSSSYGTPNSVAMLAIDDPADNVLFEAHQYLDASGGGQAGTCVDATIGARRLAVFVDWLRAHHLKGIVGELAGGNNATCAAAVKGMLAYMMQSTDVLQGWTWWGGGPWWPTSYPFVLDPSAGKDAPQMAWLTPYL